MASLNASTSGEEKKNEEVFAKEAARRGVRQKESESEPVKLYLEENFRSYVEEKYAVTDKNLLDNTTILQMIYALEWYDVPRNAQTDLVEFHPYLTKDDHEKLYYVKSQHLFELGASSLLFTLVSNRILNNQGPLIFRSKRYVRLPSALFFGGLLTYALNHLLLRSLLQQDLKEEKLDRYFTLDLNADMMKQDLEGMGIRVKAANFNMDETQSRID